MQEAHFDNPPWLNKKLVGTALRNIVKDPSIVVKEVTFSTAGGKRGKFGSDFFRVIITYKCTAAAHTEQQFVVKSLSSDKRARDFLIKWKYFEKEIHMYDVTLPAMYAMIPPLINKHVPPTDPLFLSASAYHTGRPHTVILEDLSKQGYALCTKKLGLDHGHTRLALEGMAKFHALSLALYKKDPSSMTMYEEKFFVESNREQIRQLVEQPFIDLPNEVAKWPGYERFAEKIRQVRVIDRVIEAMSSKPGSVSVLNHGDFWTSNMMFKYVKGEAVAVKFVDFQQCRFVSPALDIIFFMFSTPSEVVRDSFWDTFLEIYHKTFCDTLKLAKTDVNLLSVQQITDAIQEKMYFGLLVACTMLPLTLAALENTKLEGLEIYSTERFKKAFQKLLNFFEKRGIL